MSLFFEIIKREQRPKIRAKKKTNVQHTGFAVPPAEITKEQEQSFQESAVGYHDPTPEI